MPERDETLVNGLAREYSVLWRELSVIERELRSRPDADAIRRRAALREGTVGLRAKYCLAIVAAGEASLRDFLGVSDERLGLGTLIDRTHRKMGLPATSRSRLDWHGLREARNSYAHGRGDEGFPEVESTARIVESFLRRLPR